MKPIFMQKKNRVWYPAYEEDKNESANYKENQLVEFIPKTVGAKKQRSINQLRMYWGLVRTVLNNSTLFLSEVELSEYIKLKIGYIKSVLYIDGKQHMITGSISVKEMEHFHFCGYMDKAITVMADILGVEEYELLNNYKENI